MTEIRKPYCGSVFLPLCLGVLVVDPELDPEDAKAEPIGTLRCAQGPHPARQERATFSHRLRDGRRLSATSGRPYFGCFTTRR